MTTYKAKLHFVFERSNIKRQFFISNAILIIFANISAGLIDGITLEIRFSPVSHRPVFKYPAIYFIL